MTTIIDARRLLDIAVQVCPTLTPNGAIPIKGANDGWPYEDLTPYLLEIATCADWIHAYAHPRKSINRTWSSYGLKHIVEDSTLAHAAGHYVCNGAFIAAAIGLGYVWTQGVLNPGFAMGFARGAAPVARVSVDRPECCRRMRAQETLSPSLVKQETPSC